VAGANNQKGQQNKIYVGSGENDKFRVND